MAQMPTDPKEINKILGEMDDNFQLAIERQKKLGDEGRVPGNNYVFQVSRMEVQINDKKNMFLQCNYLIVQDEFKGEMIFKQLYFKNEALNIGMKNLLLLMKFLGNEMKSIKELPLIAEKLSKEKPFFQAKLSYNKAGFTEIMPVPTDIDGEWVNTFEMNTPQVEEPPPTEQKKTAGKSKPKGKKGKVTKNEEIPSDAPPEEDNSDKKMIDALKKFAKGQDKDIYAEIKDSNALAEIIESIGQWKYNGMTEKDKALLTKCGLSDFEGEGEEE